MGATNIIRKPSHFPVYRTHLRAMMPRIRETAPDFDFNIGMQALTWAHDVNQRRGLPKNELFSDPLVLAEALVDLVGADAETLYAAMIYPSIRPDRGAHFDATYLDEISPLFMGDDAVVREEYVGVKDLAVNALQIRACDLITPPPRKPESVEGAFDKPSAQEAENLAAYFIMSRGIIRDDRAWAIRATQWYLRLVDMREHPQRYTEQERFNAYYYTDKFYAPFAEYLALQRLKDDASYAPQYEDRGLYRLKVAMEEELIRQINPDAYEGIQGYMQDFVRSFDVERGHRKGQPNRKLVDIVRLDVEEALKGILEREAIPPDFIRIEARWKKPRSIYQKLRAGRNDIHDYFGVRIIIDFDAWEKKAGKLPSRDKRKQQESVKHLCGKLHAAIAKRFEEVDGRYKNFYVKPYEPDNGYRAVQNTFRIFGQDVEVQIVDLASHINNSIGSASHFFHKLFGDKKGERKTGLSISDMMAAFSRAKSNVVVRTAGGLFVLDEGARVSDLARKIHSGLGAKAVSAVITDKDPLNLLTDTRVPLDAPLRSGQFVYIETGPAVLVS